MTNQISANFPNTFWILTQVMCSTMKWESGLSLKHLCWTWVIWCIYWSQKIGNCGKNARGCCQIHAINILMARTTSLIK